MSTPPLVSRRVFLASTAGASVAGHLLQASPQGGKIPVGLELFSVREKLKKDLMGTVGEVAKLGYQCVEFYSPYQEWTADYTHQVKAELDRLNIRCSSTHNDMKSFSAVGMDKAIELNRILGAKYIVLAHPGKITDLDGWKKLADDLNAAQRKFHAEGLNAGYHNHQLEWKEVDGKKPLEVLAAGTDQGVMLQLDVGTCIETGNDPVAWIEKNPGRIRSLHCKDWSPDKGYEVLFGDGVAPWPSIFQAAEAKGGVEFYLIEQEGSSHPEMETAQLCLTNYRKLRV